MRLFLAEKQIQAETIAKALNAGAILRDGYFECGPPDEPRRDVVTWANGHLYRLAEWEEYDPALRDWKKLDLLPFVPSEWRLVPDPNAMRQIAVINELVRQADLIIHACDADREGQLIGDVALEKAFEAAEAAGTPVRAKVLRLCNIDGNSVLDQTTIEQALASLRPNSESTFVNLSRSALARTIGDQLVGFSLTRKCTIDGRRAGWRHAHPISVGRVQTPTLALIVERDRKIERFIPQRHYRLLAEYDYHGKSFIATWKPDEDGLIFERALCEKAHAAIVGQPATVLDARHKRQLEKHPLPHSLSSLQVQASEERNGGLTARQVLAAAQNLYERHRLISYPRTNCRYLPKKEHERALLVLHAIARNDPSKATLCASADTSLRSNAFDDTKVKTHHAIVPLPRSGEIDPASLTSEEKIVYGLVAQAYIAQFHPDAIYEISSYTLQCNGLALIAEERRPVSLGWKRIYKANSEIPPPAIPRMRPGETCRPLNSAVKELQTQPPPRYTDGTLISAMVNVHTQIEDQALRAKLAAFEGLGTDATRDDIIETLLERRYVRRQGRWLVSTPKGRALVDSLPAEICKADLTAMDEAELERIADGQGNVDAFVAAKAETVRRLLPRIQMKKNDWAQLSDEGNTSPGRARPRRTQLPTLQRLPDGTLRATRRR
jgi:DNA topoisomerase-3